MMTNFKQKDYSLVTHKNEECSEEKTKDEKTAGKSSLWKSLVTLLSEIEGTVLLALPFVIAQGGIVSIIALAFVPIICCYTGKILIECLYVEDNQGQKVWI